MSDRINEAGVPASEMMNKVKTEEEKLQDKIKEMEGTIQALKGMLSQLIPVVEVIVPHLKNHPQVDQEKVAQIEKMVQIATMLSAMGDAPEEVLKSLN